MKRATLALLRLRLWLGALAALACVSSVSAALAAEPAAVCPNVQPADGLLHVGNAANCLVMRLHAPADPMPGVLAVFMHGDNSGRTELRANRGAAFNLADKLRLTTVALQRPGYVSELGKSDGYNRLQDDDYTPGNVRIVAAALAHLRQLHPDKKLLLIGHSGGSAMAALTAARFPDSADAFMVAACPCDVRTWREWRHASAGRSAYWPHSLSPQAEAPKILPGTRIALLVGNRDDNTLPKFSEAFVAQLQTQGVQARLVLADGATHSSVLQAPEFFALALELARQLARELARELAAPQPPRPPAE
jgi:pimeloyl-ACP methyl ester carboxylesterase